jgi:hypothetical protein
MTPAVAAKPRGFVSASRFKCNSRTSQRLDRRPRGMLRHMSTPVHSDRNDDAATTSFPQRKAFVLQFSAEAGPQTGLFRGRIEHVTTGTGASFDSTEELWAFVRQVLMRSSAVELLGLPAARGKAA